MKGDLGCCCERRKKGFVLSGGVGVDWGFV